MNNGLEHGKTCSIHPYIICVLFNAFQTLMVQQFGAVPHGSVFIDYPEMVPVKHHRLRGKLGGIKGQYDEQPGFQFSNILILPMISSTTCISVLTYSR